MINNFFLKENIVFECEDAKCDYFATYPLDTKNDGSLRGMKCHQRLNARSNHDNSNQAFINSLRLCSFKFNKFKKLRYLFNGTLGPNGENFGHAGYQGYGYWDKYNNCSHGLYRYGYYGKRDQCISYDYGDFKRFLVRAFIILILMISFKIYSIPLFFANGIYYLGSQIIGKLILTYICWGFSLLTLVFSITHEYQSYNWYYNYDYNYVQSYKELKFYGGGAMVILYPMVYGLFMINVSKSPTYNYIFYWGIYHIAILALSVVIYYLLILTVIILFVILWGIVCVGIGIFKCLTGCGKCGKCRR